LAGAGQAFHDGGRGALGGRPQEGRRGRLEGSHCKRDGTGAVGETPLRCAHGAPETTRVGWA
jgi:hypothetical protein